MGRAAKGGELLRAAQWLGVTSAALGQRGWKSASAARIPAVMDDSPDWLIAAGENQGKKRAKQQRRRAQQRTASRLGIHLRAVKDRDIRPTDVEELPAAQPEYRATQLAQRAFGADGGC
jgi:hypothetical protein